MKSVDALSLLGFAGQSPNPDAPVHWHGPWESRFETRGGQYSAYANDPTCSVVFRGIDGPGAIVVMCTAWSGSVELEAGGQRVIVDTYAPEHVEKTFELPGTGRRDVTLRVLERRHADAHDSQIWLHGLQMSKRPAWQARYREVTASLSLVDGDFGTFLVFNKDRPVSHDIKIYGAWGPQQVRQFEVLVRPGSTVADVGANLGHHTVVLSHLVGPRGRVLAFEPQRRVHRILQANLALNACDNVTAFEYALGSEDADAQMLPQDYDAVEWNVGGLAIATAQGKLEFREDGLPIKIRRLDDVPGARELDFVKSDAQGFDFAVFQGGAEVLKSARPIIVAEVAPAAMRAAGMDYLEFYGFLRGLGYRLADADRPDFDAGPRSWSGKVDEEWDILAIHEARPEHMARALLL